MITDKVFFDARYIRFDHHDGISRFSAALFAALSMRTKVVAVIYDHRQLEKLPQGTEFIMANQPTSWREPFIASTLNRAGAKVVFSPMQTIGSFGRKYKLILTLHDLIYYNHKTPPAGFNAAITSISSALTINGTNALTYNGKVLVCTSGPTITFDGSTLPIGFTCMILQSDNSLVNFTGTVNRYNYSSTSGIYSIATVLCYATGSVLLTGDIQ